MGDKESEFTPEIPERLRVRMDGKHLVFCLLLVFATPVLAAASSPPMPGRLVDAGGHRVHLYCTGQGAPTVVVVSGGFSVDWALVQPSISRFTRICTYDPAGAAWSDPASSVGNYGTNRVNELRALLATANEAGPYVLVGYSIGGPVVRLYAARYRKQIAGMVLVDHAFVNTKSGENAAVRSSGPIAKAGLDSPPVLISQSPIKLDMEDDQNFSRLPVRDRELHQWALTVSVRPTPENAIDCMDEVAEAENGRNPLESLPLAIVSTPNTSPQYTQLQRELLALSSNSKQYLAENSYGHH